MHAMNFILYAQRRVSASFMTVARMLFAPSFSHPVARDMGYRQMQRPRVSSAPFGLQTGNSPIRASSVKPLRVLRVMEPGQQRASVGRMVISGRMADVCAELDRLAAREAAMS